MNAYDSDLHLTRNLAQESANRASYLRSLTGRNFLFGGAAAAAAVGLGAAACIWAWNQGTDPEMLAEALKKMPTLQVEGTVKGMVEMKDGLVSLKEGATIALEDGGVVTLAEGSVVSIDPGATVSLAPGGTVSLDNKTLSIDGLQKLLNPQNDRPAMTKDGDIIKREVTVFSNVAHEQGVVQSGWTYADGASKRATRQFCQYMYDEYFTRIATNRQTESSQRRKVPNFQQAVAKCQWTN